LEKKLIRPTAPIICPPEAPGGSRKPEIYQLDGFILKPGKASQEVCQFPEPHMGHNDRMQQEITRNQIREQERYILPAYGAI
jgi:hypothetical protein